MGPSISPRVPYIRAMRLVAAATQWVVRPAGHLLRRVITHTANLLFITVVCLLAPSILLARTPAQIRFNPLSFWSLYKWYVVAAVVTFLVQAFLIARLLVIQAGRRQAEERFAKSFKANPQPMSLTRLEDGLYLDVNESFLAMSGYTREEVVGHTSIELKVWAPPEQ